MLTTEKINELIGVNESYQASYSLKDILFDKEKRVQVFREFLKEESDLTFDWFTDYFQEEHSDRKGKKQDFTPDSIVKIASNILGSTNSNADICAGTGGLTIKRYASNPDANFYCEEFSDRAMPFLLLNLMIRNVNATVAHGDSLTREFKHIYKLTKGEEFSDLTEIKDMPSSLNGTVIMNPPYSLGWKPKAEMLEEERFKGYEALAPKSKADYAFLLTGLSKLEGDGIMTVILPHGVLFRGQAEGKIRKHLIDLNLLDAVIGLPEKTFLNTDIPTVILVLKKNRINRDILFIDASKQFTKGKNHNIIEEQHVETILNTYQNRVDVDKLCHVVQTSELKENEYNLNIPRYVDTFEPEVLPSVEELISDLKKADKESQEIAVELGNTMQQLVGTTPEADREIKALTDYWCNRYGVKKTATAKDTQSKRGEQLSLL